MCTKIIHTYGCGHRIIEIAPCASSRTGPCGVLKINNVNHGSSKCDKCDR
ncbi:hypothetical protein IWX90DRAFT_381000 [Phyllosticta citrichinensis]|uniref:Uncharacterized protein n=1 Tax=Phyllosticta citrichinensis TaxID=1130410 RepID=A0ABR1XXY3_9PEZI